MAPLLAVRGISKSFPGVQALKQVDFDLQPGEVHALIGENGAGKSTLIKILGGIYQPDAGEILLGGKKTVLRNPADSQGKGISIIHQELNLIESLTVAENIFLGRLPGAKIPGFISWDDLFRRAKEILDIVDIDLHPATCVADLSIGQKQMVEIAKAVSINARVLIMDEPTAALSRSEIENLFKLISNMKKRGVGIIYVSHRLEEVFASADQVTVLRDGEKIGTRKIDETDTDMLITMMVGRKLTEMYPKQTISLGNTILEVKGLTTTGQLQDITFNLREGEILGIFGIAGAGQDELAKALIGARKILAGDIYLEGQRLSLRSPQHALRAGIGMVPAERKVEGLVLGRSVKENITLSNACVYFRYGFLNELEENRKVQRWVEELRIRTPSLHQQVGNLSGGNQQKVVLARLLDADTRVIILNEPTRGIDVGAKVEVYLLLEKLCAQGKAVIMISSELPEILALSDRILVLCRGRVTGCFERGAATQEQILRCAIGEANNVERYAAASGQ